MTHDPRHDDTYEDDVVDPRPLSMTEQANSREYDKMRREREWTEKGERFADKFSAFLNSSASEPQDAAIKKMLRDHRSLQQDTMRFFIRFAEGMAESEHDLRNQASVELAEAIVRLNTFLPRV